MLRHLPQNTLLELLKRSFYMVADPWEYHLCKKQAIVGEIVGIGWIGVHCALVQVLDFVKYRRSVGRLTV